MNQDEMTIKEELGKEEHIPKMSMEKKDLLTCVFLILFGIYVLGSGIYMSVTSLALSDSPWYGTPGMFPIFIGTVLILLASIMMVSLLHAGVRLDNEGIVAAKNYFKGSSWRRFLAAVGFFAVYVAVFGRINFSVSTFLYLFVTMLYFRENKFAIWKIAVISASFTGFMYLFFGVLAGIPLP